jgi:hypothetical protein
MKPTELKPSREMTDLIGIGCRLAYGVMLRTRAQLVAMHGEIEHKHVDQMMAHLCETAEWLKATTHMVESAYMRVLASAAAAYTQGGGVMATKKKQRAPRVTRKLTAKMLQDLCRRLQEQMNIAA